MFVPGFDIKAVYNVLSPAFSARKKGGLFRAWFTWRTVLDAALTDVYMKVLGATLM